jgi:polysaccharide chain length determinant protein (PEP-CTERM system associated)
VIPGKQYTPEDVAQIAWRRKWLILIPAVLISAGVVVWTYNLVDQYRSEAIILVVPPRVPEEYVRPTVTSRVEDRLQSLRQQIVSRTRLERIILDFDLYADERRTGIMEDIVDNMRDAIGIDPIRGDAFRVSFTNEDPRMAMRVAERLATLIIDESLRDREVLAEGTNQFLEAQLEEARRLLIDNEQKQLEYRRRHEGQLPTQLSANLQGLNNTEMQLQQLAESVSRDRDRRLLLERALADATSAEAMPAPAGSGPQTAAQALAGAEQALTAMRLKVTEEHPDVVRLKRTIAELQAQADAEALNRPVSGAASSPAELARANRITELTRQIEDLDKVLAQKAESEKRLLERLASYQARIEATPSRESELTDLTRDYSTYQANYRNLLAKKQDSQLAANLERRQIGEQFRIIDPARLPQRPYSPNRPRYYLMGILAAMAVAFGLAGLVEYLDRTMRSEDDVRAALQVPVLATVPMVFDTSARRRQRWLLAASVTTVVILASAAVMAAWTYLS